MKVKTNKVGTGAVRVTIPQKIRKPLGIQAGDVLEVSRRGNKIIFEKVKP
jgi:AbrB family looped-hinge helix DNA binding protein